MDEGLPVWLNAFFTVSDRIITHQKRSVHHCINSAMQPPFMQESIQFIAWCVLNVLCDMMCLSSC